MRSRIRWIRATAAVCVATMLGGCYMYSGVSVTAVPVGSEVRARVTAAEADRTETVLGRRSTTLQGEVLGNADGQLLLRVPTQVFSSTGQTRRYYQRVALTPADVLDLETRKLNVARTSVLLAVGVAAIALIAKSAFSGRTGGILPGGSTTGVQNAIVIPFH